MAAPIRPSHLAAALAAPLLFAACAHQPREFDVSGPAPAEERVAAPGPVAANLTGAWEINYRESEPPEQYRGGRGGEAGMSGARRGRMGGGGRPGMGGTPGSSGIPGGTGGGGDYPGSAGMPPRAGGYGGGGNGGGGGRSGGRGEGGARDSAFAGVARRMTIVQTDTTLALTRGAAGALTLWFDGRDVVIPDAMGNSEARANGRWHGKRFEVRRILPNDRTVLESFELFANGTKLAVRTRVTSAGERSGDAPPEIRRVYDRVNPPGPAAQPSTPPAATPAKIGNG